MNEQTERPWAYSAFPVTIGAVRRISTGFVRITLQGEALEHFAPWGLDQRIKVVLPMADRVIAEFGLLAEPTPHPSEWYTRWRELPDDDRNVLRTYTPAAIRPERREIDVDFFIHEPAGPASKWAQQAVAGDQLVITGPDARNGYTGYGIHWTPGHARRFALIGDETAFPAMSGILRSLPAAADVEIIVETRREDDLVALSDDRPRRIAHRRGEPGAALEAAVREWTSDLDHEDDALYVWIAGESESVTRIRRHLRRDIGLAKDQIAFLGYWKQGGPLVS